MDILTSEHCEQPILNWRNQNPVRDTVAELDLTTMVKLFMPAGNATWLLTELDKDEDTAFGLHDLGPGGPELGCVSLSDLTALRTRLLKLPIEHDLYFVADKSLSAYCPQAGVYGYAQV